MGSVWVEGVGWRGVGGGVGCLWSVHVGRASWVRGQPLNHATHTNHQPQAAFFSPATPNATLNSLQFPGDGDDQNRQEVFFCINVTDHYW